MKLWPFNCSSTDCLRFKRKVIYLISIFFFLLFFFCTVRGYCVTFLMKPAATAMLWRPFFNSKHDVITVNVGVLHIVHSFSLHFALQCML